MSKKALEGLEYINLNPGMMINVLLLVPIIIMVIGVVKSINREVNKKQFLSHQESWYTIMPNATFDCFATAALYIALTLCSPIAYILVFKVGYKEVNGLIEWLLALIGLLGAAFIIKPKIDIRRRMKELAFIVGVFVVFVVFYKIIV